MAKSKHSKWMHFKDAPEEVKHYLRAYNEAVSGLHQTNNVVRFMGTDPVRVFVQRYGRVTVGQLLNLEERAGCRVEVGSVAPNYLMIMLFGDQTASVLTSTFYDSEPTNFQYREL